MELLLGKLKLHLQVEEIVIKNSDMRVILVLSICFLSCLGSKAQSEEELIKEFVRDLFDPKIHEETISKKYLSILQENTSSTASLKQRNKNRLLYIKALREQMHKNKEEATWLTPSMSNADPENIVAKYLDYADLDSFDFMGRKDEGITNNMYVLLNKDSKISYFTLFVKSGDASFFGF